MDDFKLFSQTSSDAHKELNPCLGFRSWNDLYVSEKEKVLKHLEADVFALEKIQSSIFLPSYSHRENINRTLKKFNRMYRSGGYAKNMLKHGRCSFKKSPLDDYCLDCKKSEDEDLKLIFLKEDQIVVFEFLSLFLKMYGKESNLSAINDIFKGFRIDMLASRTGFIPNQEELIRELLIEPALKRLSDSKWKDVNQNLKDALSLYHNNSPEAYSSAITNLVAAFEAFLRAKVGGKIGKCSISKLIKMGKDKGSLPKDQSSELVMNTIQSIVMERRQETGIAHPKEEYANEKSVLLVFNLILVFIQHTHS